MRIKYKKKKRKAHKLYGQKYRGYGQVGRNRHHPGGRGRAGTKDHMKIKLLKEGYEFGSGRGFTRHGVKWAVRTINVGVLAELILDNKIDYKEKDGLYEVDFSSKRVKILGGGRVPIPLRIILDDESQITENARSKIESAGGEVIIRTPAE